MPLDAGEVDAAFAEADHVVSQRFVNQRLIPNSIEPRGVLAEYLPGEGNTYRLVIDASASSPQDHSVSAP